MKYILVTLAVNNKTGFGNQIYIMAHAISWAIENKIDIVFFTKFLNQINTEEYSNVSDIINIKLTNEFLLKYNVQIADYYNFDFKLNNIKYGYNNLNIDIFDNLKYFINTNNQIIIPNSYSFSEINKLLLDIFTNYNITLENNDCKLNLEYKLDNVSNTISYPIFNHKLEKDIVINFDNIQEYSFSVKCYTELFYNIRTNIKFKNYYSDTIVKYFIDENINTKQNINCIHLRLENDAICAWAEILKISELEMINLIEQKYITNIVQNIKKDDLTIILSSNYNNNVIKFLKENNYNFITTPSWSEFRDISAIYDLHVADYCNNTFIGMFESSFSYLILFRIKDNIRNYVEIKSTED